MSENSDKSAAAFWELVRVLEEALQVGVDSLGLEYEDGRWFVYHRFGNTGLGAARIAEEHQQAVIQEIVERAGLARKRRGKIQVKLLGKDYDVLVEEYDSFGESAFNLKLKERRQQPAGLKLFVPKKPTRKAAVPEQPGDPAKVRIYTLDVFLPRKRLSKAFAKNKSGVSRLIQIRGDQTLADLHHAIFNAFDREEEHLYEFQFGAGPRDSQGPIYGVQDAEDGDASQTTIDSLRLKVGRSFGYLFDFGDNWQHQINVKAIEDQMPQGPYPKVIKRVGNSPPQYADENE